MRHTTSAPKFRQVSSSSPTRPGQHRELRRQPGPGRGAGPSAGDLGVDERRAHSAERPSFSIVIGRFLGTVVLTLRGPFDRHAATRLGATLEDLIDGQGNLAVAIDLRQVSQLGPSGVHVLRSAASALERKGGRLWLSDPPHPILRVLRAGGLSRHFGYPHTLGDVPRGQHPDGD